MIWDSYTKGWKNIFNFTGRATRMEYWMFTILNFLFVTVLLTAIMVPAGLALEDPQEIFGKFGVLIVFVMIPYIFAVFSQLVRRIRDTGISGWWTLLFLPVNALLYGIPSFILGFIPSSQTSNGNNTQQQFKDNSENSYESHQQKPEPELKRYEYEAPQTKSNNNNSESRKPSKPLKRLD